jgi:hypothetical protein
MLSYVTEFFTAGFGTPGDVIRIALNPDGSAGARTVMGVGALVAPNGFAAGPDGSIYVSNFSVFPGVNAIRRASSQLHTGNTSIP